MNYDYDYNNINNQVPYNSTNSERDNREANILCGISLACVIAPILLFVSLALLGANLGMAGSGFENFSVMLSVGMMIAGFVLMIYVRVKYPKNVFGKVLMWCYIVGIIITLVVVITSLVFLYLMCNMTMEYLEGCNL